MRRRQRLLMATVASCAALMVLAMSIQVRLDDVREGLQPTVVPRPTHHGPLSGGSEAVPTAFPQSDASLVIRGKQRGGSGDLVTGDGFRLMADFVVDETTSDIQMEAEAIASCKGHGGSVVVFVQTHLLTKFLVAWLPKKHACHIRLVTHNSDYSSPWEATNTRWKSGVATAYEGHRRDVLDNADVEVWYAQNAVVVHPKLQPIPIGIENRYNKYGAHFDVYQEAFRMSELPRPAGSVFVSFNVKTNPKERGQALLIAKRIAGTSGLITFYQGSPPKKAGPEEYRAALTKMVNTMMKHQFVLAPHGHGVDTHRMWEALYAGCIPIVQRSPMDHNLLDQLPVLIVEDYAQLNASMLATAAQLLSPRWESARRTYLSRKYWESLLHA